MKTKTKKAMTAGRQGFTLIELLIVIAIIGILAGVILVNTSSSRGKANKAAFLEELKSAPPAFANQCNDGPITLPTASNNVTWTAGQFDSCGPSGNATFCEEATNITSFVSAKPGDCIVFVGQGGIYTDNLCTQAADMSTYAGCQ